MAGIWDGAKKRQAQHETLRRIIDSGKPVDEALMDKILGKEKRQDRDLRVAGIIVLSVAVGVAVLGAFVSVLDERALMPILGLAGLLVCLGFGLLAASKAARRWQKEDLHSGHDLPGRG